MNNHPIDTKLALQFAILWCIAHFILMLCRLPRSDYRINRLKLYGIGFTMFWFLIGSVAFIAWGNSHNIFETAFAFTAGYLGQAITGMGYIFILVAGGFIAMSLVFGQAATMWGSWINDDINCMDLL